MSDQFDKKLVDKISEAFENFEDDTSQEGWAELRKRFPGEKNRRPLIWWFSSAAAILLIAAASLYLEMGSQVLNENESSSISGNPTNKVSKDQQTPDSADLFEKSVDQKFAVRVTNPNPVRTQRSKNLAVNTERHLVPEISNLTDSSARESSEHDLMLMALVPDKTGSDKGNTNALLDTAANSTPITDSRPVLADNLTTEPVEKPVFPDEVITKQQLSDLVKNKKDRSKNNKKDKLSFGFFAGTYLNYADGSQTSVNTGAGVSSEYRISSKLKIQTGISFGQNSLKYDGSAPSQATLRADQPAKNWQLDQLYSPAFANSSSGYSINSYDAKLTGLDIPVNLKYVLSEKKNTVFISTGLSSNFFINESYSYAFDYKMTGNNSLTVADQRSSSTFQSFDFARVLNVSVGIDRDLPGNMRLSFEPFVKYPLSGLGEYDLKFGAAGLNLKINFNRLK